MKRITPKIRLAAITLCAPLFCAPLLSCGDNPLSVTRAAWTITVPESWTNIPRARSLRWKLEWIGPDGSWKTLDIAPAEHPTVELPQTRPVPVAAWPYIAGTELTPGLLKPAGAIFPYDAEEDRLDLSLLGGVDALLYQELALAWEAARGGAESSGANPRRQPQYFNWPRFRALFTAGELPKEVLLDPWIVDWKDAAAKMVRSGFDKRRLKRSPRTEKTIPLGPALKGPWRGGSPFAPPRVFENTEAVFPAANRLEAWFSAEGILKIQGDRWIFLPWDS